MNKEQKPFGYSLLLDCHQCEADLNCLETAYLFLEELVARLNMTQNGSVALVHNKAKYEVWQEKNNIPIEEDIAAVFKRVDLYPLKAGISGFVPLVESSLVLHTVVPDKFATIDIYSCRSFSKDVAYNFVKSVYKFKSAEVNWVERGIHYLGGQSE